MKNNSNKKISLWVGFSILVVNFNSFMKIWSSVFCGEGYNVRDYKFVLIFL